LGSAPGGGGDTFRRGPAARKRARQARTMPQGDYIELHRKRHGVRMDQHERQRKRDAREVRRRSKQAQSLTGIKAKLFNRQRFKEKAAMKKTLNMHFETEKAHADADQAPDGAVPAYLLDREAQTRSKVLSNTLKQKRKEKAGKWNVPLPKVRPIAEDEMFRVVKTGKRKAKQWKRQITKCTFVGEGFTRKPPKYERFIRPMGLRVKKANVTHPELKTTFYLPILAVKKNPSSQMYTQLGVVTRGAIIEVDVADLGLVTTSGKVIFGSYAQVTNNPENDGCVNAVLLV
jgi:ribosome biogenesis protein NSA2